MATKRKRGNVWEYTVRRAGVLPRPAHLRFSDEGEGDEYVRRIEALLDRGSVREELRDRDAGSTLLRDQVSLYTRTQHISTIDQHCLAVLATRLPKDLSLQKLTFVWASDWVTSMKQQLKLAPVTIRHHVGALARALDWIGKRGDVPFSPLRCCRAATPRTRLQTSLRWHRSTASARRAPSATAASRATRRGSGRSSPARSPTAVSARSYFQSKARSNCRSISRSNQRCACSRPFERTKLSDLEIARIKGHRDPRMLKRYANLRGSHLAEHLWERAGRSFRSIEVDGASLARAAATVLDRANHAACGRWCAPSSTLCSLSPPRVA